MNGIKTTLLMVTLTLMLIAVGGILGGKTGTTQLNSDGWFMGVSKDLVTATWVGGDTRSIRFRQMQYGQGAHAALPIFAYFIKDVLKDKSLDFKLEALDKFEGDPTIETDCEEYKKKNEPPINEAGAGLGLG